MAGFEGLEGDLAQSLHERRSLEVCCGNGKSEGESGIVAGKENPSEDHLGRHRKARGESTLIPLL